MHPLGCYGSSLAYAPTSDVCKGCDAASDCAKLVETRRPLLIRLLEKFLDAQGRPMSLPWLSPAERRARKKAEREAEEDDTPAPPKIDPQVQRVATTQANRATLVQDVIGDGETVTALVAQLDTRATRTFNKLVAGRVDPRRASLDTIGAAHPAMSIVCGALSQRPHKMTELTALLASRCGYSASNARREAFAHVSILTACERATRSGQFVELT